MWGCETQQLEVSWTKLFNPIQSKCEKVWGNGSGGQKGGSRRQCTEAVTTEVCMVHLAQIPEKDVGKFAQFGQRFNYPHKLNPWPTPPSLTVAEAESILH
mmetsp:Transcript_108266/g.187006  ORF Transcript_108266/g.187006 Transcript_108266/m.187006 type:complete len:100 (-) Transcript_108266:255-554(-)